MSKKLKSDLEFIETQFGIALDDLHDLRNANESLLETIKSLREERAEIQRQDAEFIRTIEHVQINMIEQQKYKKTQHAKSLNAAGLVAIDLLLEKFKEIRGMK